MGNSTKLVSFNSKIDPKILEEWKDTITHNELIRGRLEEALQDNIKKHKEKNEG